MSTSTDTIKRDFDYGCDIQKIEALAKRLASHDWEYAACAEALLELHHPSLSVFSPHCFPNGRLPELSSPGDISALQYVKDRIQLGADNLFNNDWGVADPAALGVSALLVGQCSGLPNSEEFRDAARRQAEYLLKRAPLWANAAMSHRKKVVELWADFIYMVPPFLAYYAVATQDTYYLKHSFGQCSLYRAILLDGSESGGHIGGLWQHIVGSERSDPGFWSTGNGWVAAGLCRVLATVKHWKPVDFDVDTTISKLGEWIDDIIRAAMATDDHESGLLRNYLNDDSWFGEISGTALLASVVFRMAVLLPDKARGSDLKWAMEKRERVLRSIDEEGVAKPAVQPLDHGLREPLMTGSPEGQSFVLMMCAAHRDYCIQKQNKD